MRDDIVVRLLLVLLLVAAAARPANAQKSAARWQCIGSQDYLMP
ncbi:MAG: hypothetical protein ABI969_04620 [bacterium]